MAKTLQQKLAALPEARRAAIEAETRSLIAEESNLRALRKGLTLTQATLARELGVGQDEVSRVERRADMLVSTLRRYVEAMGGELDLIARFPDREVRIAHLGDVITEPDESS